MPSCTSSAPPEATGRPADFRLLLRLVLLQPGFQLALSIRLRNPYVDPISLLQVELLRRWRAEK